MIMFILHNNLIIKKNDKKNDLKKLNPYMTFHIWYFSYLLIYS